jgi:hypothetical protein
MKRLQHSWLAAQAVRPVACFFDLSAGSDYPGTLTVDDSMAQLKTSSDDPGSAAVVSMRISMTC